MDKRTTEPTGETSNGMDETRAKSWKDRHGGTLMAVISGLLVLVLIVLNANC